jgi:hypothetical protein
MDCGVRRLLDVEFLMPLLFNTHVTTLRQGTVVVSTTEYNAHIPIIGNVLIGVPLGIAKLYGTAGVGTLPDHEFKRFGLVLDAGAGVKVYVGRHIIFRADARHYYANVKSAVLYGPAQIRFIFEDTMRFNELSIGVGFRR